MEHFDRFDAMLLDMTNSKNVLTKKIELTLGEPTKKIFTQL